MNVIALAMVYLKVNKEMKQIQAMVQFVFINFIISFNIIEG